MGGVRKHSGEQMIWYRLEPRKTGKPSDKEIGWREVETYEGK